MTGGYSLGQTVRQRPGHPPFPCDPKPVPFQPLYCLSDHSTMSLPRAYEQDRAVPLDGLSHKLARPLKEGYGLFQVDQVDIGSSGMNIRDVGGGEGRGDVPEVGGRGHELGKEVGVG